MKDVNHSKESVFLFSLGLTIVYIALHLSGCSYPVPKVDVTFWAGDSAHASIRRSQDEEQIFCSDPKFDEYAALSYQDIKNIYEAMLQCKEWGPPVATQQQLQTELKHNNEVIQRVLSTKKRE